MKSSNVRFTRILPIVFIMYMLAYADRNNMGFGITGGMGKSLGLDAAFLGTASGIFFLGYVLLQIPAGYIATRFGVRKLVFIFQIIWGILATLTGFVQSGTQLLVVRFLLGMAESALYPAALVLVARWFPLKERGRANGIWQTAGTVGSIFLGPISGLILQDFLNWRYLFIIEGLPAIIWAFVWYYFLSDSPKEAKFVSDSEKEYLEKEFAKDEIEHPPVSKNWKEGLLNKKIWVLTLIYLMMNVGYYGITLWMPVIMQSITKAGFISIGLLSALPSIFNVIGMYTNAHHSDKTGDRKWHAALALICAAVALVGSVATYNFSHVLAVIFIIIALGFQGGFTCLFWTVPPLMVSEEGLGSSMGFINGIGNLGGFFGPMIVGNLIKQAGGSTNTGLGFCAVVLIIAGIAFIITMNILEKQVGKNSVKRVS